jgi:hypothetical protein
MQGGPEQHAEFYCKASTLSFVCEVADVHPVKVFQNHALASVLIFVSKQYTNP